MRSVVNQTVNESVPTPPSPERPPLAPYDPPDPAPQAAAWSRAIKVVTAQAASPGGFAQTKLAAGRSQGQGMGEAIDGRAKPWANGQAAGLR